MSSWDCTQSYAITQPDHVDTTNLNRCVGSAAFQTKEVQSVNRNGSGQPCTFLKFWEHCHHQSAIATLQLHGYSEAQKRKRTFFPSLSLLVVCTASTCTRAPAPDNAASVVGEARFYFWHGESGARPTRRSFLRICCGDISGGQLINYTAYCACRPVSSKR